MLIHTWSFILFSNLALTPPFSMFVNSILHVQWKSNGNSNQQYKSSYSVPSARFFFRKQYVPTHLGRYTNFKCW